MARVVPVDDKQIAFFSYDAKDRSLIVTYYRGMSSTYRSIDLEQFETLVGSSNKMDELMKLLSAQSG